MADFTRLPFPRELVREFDRELVRGTDGGAQSPLTFDRDDITFDRDDITFDDTEA